ncbi:FlgD immunoglobulin-like domain containing protein [Desulfobotulus sp.]|jgi:flagellar basal-body rod modification protein FlgD|uniref:FlgD immunoglobulin-like domain containing protein n=1 Tax=Desulfobotulus sp. TaxID=1940337 RepID=UPI002A3627B7|nr:FlgD immunoglobulin-like domain containing protein [Desulfobotulus sp.]MDY0164039.1 FlgD immunoglobulin-like domain containing protein [Desulfobotulus sp.]
MVTTTSTNAALAKVAASYKSKEDEKKDPLGREAFLTMLVTQLQHQDPLNPMEGTDFTAQLAQFSQLEATFNTNKALESILAALQTGSSKDLEAYMGKEVLAEIDSIEVSSGKAVGGFYTLEEGAAVTVNIYNESGTLVRSLSLGQQEAGSYPISWDARNSADQQVADGSYRFDVIALGPGGLSRVQTTVEGTVDGILYANGKAYLQVQGTFVDPESLIKVWEKGSTGPVVSPMEFIGRDVLAETAVIDFDGTILGNTPGYTLDRADEVLVEIYDKDGKLVKSLYEGTKSAGENHAISWDGKNSLGITVEAGVYSYRVLTKGAVADTRVSGEVTGLVYRNGTPYLNMDGYLVSSGAVRSVG